jgi:hypothetical protein
MNMQPVHIVMLVCSAAALSLSQLEPAMPPAALPYMKLAAALCVFVAGVLGPLSPSALPPKS